MQRKTQKSVRTRRSPFAVKFVYALIAVCFCLLIFGVGALLLLTPDKAASNNENRMLAQRPTATAAAVADGSFMRKFETYLTDQFPLRDLLVTMKTKLSVLVGKREVNGVFLADNGFLLERQTPVDAAQTKEVTDAIKAFMQTHKELTGAMLLSPNASYLLREHMPYRLQQDDQRKQLIALRKQLKTKRLQWISCLTAFEDEAPETLFYRTDHHWTTRAAFDAFLALNEAWELGGSKNDYTFYPVSTTFTGTLASSFGLRGAADTIEVCIPKHSRGNYSVYYEAQGKKTATLFDASALSRKNQYEVFLGGNFDKVLISTTVNTDKALLLFKDSYANCLIPMLTPYFSKIVVIDPRYFNDALDDVLDETTFTHVLFAYNLNTFLEDHVLADVLA